MRRGLKSPAAHNTLTVDGKDFTVYKNSWDYSRMAQPVKGEYFFAGSRGLISGGHLGYLSEGVFVFRKIVRAAEGLFVIFDELYAEGRHRYTQYFHFNNEGEVVTRSGRAVFYHGKTARAKLDILTPGAELALTEAPLSRTYNELEYGKCLTSECNKENFAGLVTVVSTAPAASSDDAVSELIPVSLTRTGEILPDEKAQAVKIKNERGAYTVVCLHGEVISEVGLIEANGKKGYGKVIVFPPDNPDGIVLAW
jgi:hypothetical protein